MSTQDVLAELGAKGKYWGPRGALSFARKARDLNIVDWVNLWSGASANAHKRLENGECSEILEERSLRGLFLVNGLKAWFTAFLISLFSTNRLRPEELFVVGDVLSRAPFFGGYGTWVLQRVARSSGTPVEVRVVALVRLLELKAKNEIDLLVFVWGKMAKPTTEQEALDTRLRIKTPVICQVLKAVNNAELAETLYRKHTHAQAVRAIAAALSDG